jgi:hypothetical protein
MSPETLMWKGENERFCAVDLDPGFLSNLDPDHYPALGEASIL